MSRASDNRRLYAAVRKAGGKVVRRYLDMDEIVKRTMAMYAAKPKRRKKGQP